MRRIGRRGFLAAAALLAGGGGLWLSRRDEKPVRELPAGGWQNWSGDAICVPQSRGLPADKAALQQLIRRDDAPLRPVGAGHSFLPIACTEGTLLSLARFNQLRIEGEQAVCGAGIRLGELSRGLAQEGRALPNLPDIDQQSFAGAAATATHGTGKAFPCLSAQIEALRLITAAGDEVICSPQQEADIFNAALVSLGALGVVHEVTLRTRPAFNLHRRTWFEPYKELLARAPDLFARHRHFEFYVLPFTDYCLAISHDETDEPAQPRPPSADEDGLAELKFLRDWFSFIPSLRRTMASRAIAEAPEENIISESWALLSTPRLTRFSEMEYHVPAGKNLEGLVALDDIVRALEKNRPDAFFPIECRLTAPDDSWLSPFEIPRISIAVHAHHLEPHDYFYSLLEPIFLAHGGRPHWGKLHSLEDKDLAVLYPRWGDFLKLRQALDPKGRFLNPYLRKLFGVAA